MKRRRSELNDPLDLLLDTVCNLFGVVIFVAILAALLAGRPELPNPDEASIDPARQVTIIEIDDAEKRSAERSVGIGNAEVARRRSRLDMYRAHRDQLRDKSGEAAHIALQLADELDALERELKAATEAKDVKLRTPRQRKLAGLVPAQIAITGGRAYIVNDWSRIPSTEVIAERCVGWTTWNIEAVDAAASSYDIRYCWRAGGQDIARSIVLHVDGGVPVSGTADLQQSDQWQRQIGWFNPDRFIMSLQVAPDSFAEFAVVRGDLASRGFYYDVEVIPNGLMFRDRLLEGTPTAQ